MTAARDPMLPTHPVVPSWRRRLVKVGAEAADRVRPSGRGVVVLIYHRVGRRTTQAVDLPTAQFDDQMAELAASGRVIDLDRAVELLRSGGPIGSVPDRGHWDRDVRRPALFDNERVGSLD